ncbi:hypothetical protein LTR37_012743 [Vermiconidia calcicola]|uniref:Uncharacterized protein n=1 Tax=Vermiconidia calcicola TaxID=1690605 RepID=A0ACC3MYA5_9PEZI|nr:hypothetical protein LTR37_012743 [Vermiconidia calcicola]
MINIVVASTALFAANVLAAGCGNAIVQNNCGYSVHLSNTPASGGGYEAIDEMLEAGGSYTQKWTELSNTMGWSIKMSKNGDYSTNVLQYEYTFHNDGTIWYDLSEVDGNPWAGNWEIEGSGSCNPRQAAYRYDTDDAYGMQDCPQESTITVSICSGTGHSDIPDDSSSKSAQPSVPAASSVAAPSSLPAPSSAPAPTTTTKHKGGYQGGRHTWAANKVVDVEGDAVVDVESKQAPSPSTTLVTSSIPVYAGSAGTVTNVKVETVTQYVTAVASPEGRRQHGHRHHNRQQ